MGKKDDAAYEYLSIPRYFADLFNAKYFGGRQIVDCNKLVEADGRTPVEGSSPLFRDIKKRLPDGTRFIIVAVENQEYIDYEMPWRIMKYDCAEYERQIKEIHALKENAARKKKKKLSWLEKKMDEHDKLSPTFTVCFYHGKEPWTGPRSLKDMMDFGEIGEEWKGIFNDYHMLLACADDQGLAEKCSTQLGLLLRVLAARGDKGRMEKIKNDEKFRHLEMETGRVIAVLADIPKLLEYADDDQNMEGGLDMCIAIDEMMEDSRRQGEKTGEKRGEKRGIEKGVNRVNRLNTLLLTNNRIEDMKRAASDTAYQRQLFVEFGL